MASTPIIRYYDHLRLVYEVQARMRELRRNSEGTGGEEQQQQNRTEPVPGQSKQNPGKDGGSRVETPQESVAPPASGDYLETSLTIHDGSMRTHSTHGSFRVEPRGTRSTRWIA